MANAFLISAEEQSITQVEVTGLDDVAGLIGYDTLETDAVGDGGDCLYFDEECFIRGSAGKFQIDTLIPVAGKGVVVGVDGERLTDVSLTLEGLRSRTRFE